MAHSYHDAILDAMVAEPHEIRPLVKLAEDSPLATVRGNYVLLGSIHHFPEIYPEGAQIELPVTAWTFTDKEFVHWLSEPGHILPYNQEIWRLKQLLGLSPQEHYTHITFYWVDLRDVIRPATSIDPKTDVNQVSLNQDVPELYREWFQDQMEDAYSGYKYPWTRLGYTYDWGNRADAYGLTEFLVRKGAKVYVVETRGLQDFLKAPTLPQADVIYQHYLEPLAATTSPPATKAAQSSLAPVTATASAPDNVTASEDASVLAIATAPAAATAPDSATASVTVTAATPVHSDQEAVLASSLSETQLDATLDAMSRPSPATLVATPKSNSALDPASPVALSTTSVTQANVEGFASSQFLAQSPEALDVPGSLGHAAAAGNSISRHELLNATASESDGNRTMAVSRSQGSHVQSSYALPRSHSAVGAKQVIAALPAKPNTLALALTNLPPQINLSVILEDE